MTTPLTLTRPARIHCLARFFGVSGCFSNNQCNNGLGLLVMNLARFLSVEDHGLARRHVDNKATIHPSTVLLMMVGHPASATVSSPAGFASPTFPPACFAMTELPCGSQIRFPSIRHHLLFLQIAALGP